MYHSSPLIRTSIFLICFALSTIAASPGQFASGVNLVEVYATVVDARGEPLTALRRDDFVVEEDGVKQDVETFAAGEFPLGVAIAVDRSFSMTATQLRDVTTAAAQFVDRLRPDDEVMVLAIGSGVDIAAPLSRDHAAARAALTGLDRWGTTPLFDATLAAIDAITASHGRRALILLSDGRDRYSRAGEPEVVEKARGSGVIVYPIALARERPAVFAELASVTGGRSFAAPDARALAPAFQSIAGELRSQYLLGYSPQRAPGTRPEWRSIRVSVNRPDVRVRARDGYLSR